MQKISICCFVLFIVFVSSCNKQLSIEHPSISSTRQLNLKSYATGVTLTSAKSMAQQFLQNKNPNVTVTIKDAQTIIKNGVPYFHIINANKGFVILSPDSIYSPILAYDSINNFSFANEDLNPGLVMWMNKHAHELDFIRNTKNAFVDSIQSANKTLWKCIGSLLNQAPKNNNIADYMATLVSSVPASKSTNSTIGPLCPTLWGQDYPFNYYCPTGSTLYGYGSHDPAGCTPIAMAQVMYFWKYPTTPPPNAPSNIAYNFASMPLNKQAANLLPVAGEMQRLIHDCGLALQTSYGPTESGTAPDNIGLGFYSMHYGSYSQTNSLSQQAWSGADDGTTYATLLTNEIQTNKRPCIVSGFTIYHSGPLGTFPNPGGDGHSWVCDGSNVTTYYFGTTNTYVYNGIYTTTTTYTSSQSVSLLHMNWGWENPYAVGQLDQQGNVLTNNGWYDCSVNYTQSGSANGDENFQYFQIVNYNIHP